MNFTEFVGLLDKWGVADVLLPFFLVFTIVFAVLQKSKVLGNDSKSKSYNTIVALVMGAAVIFPHVLGTYPANADPVQIINNALPSISIVLIAILCLLLLIGILGGEVKWLGSSISGWIAILSVLIVIYIFGRASGWGGFNSDLPWWLGWLDNPDVLAFVVIILVFGILVWFITKEDKDTKTHAFNDVFKNIGELFKGGK